MPVAEVVVGGGEETGQEMIEVTDPVVILGRKASQHFLSDDLPARCFLKLCPFGDGTKLYIRVCGRQRLIFGL